MKKKIVQVVLGLPVEGPFDYSLDPSSGGVDEGSRVLVPLQSRRLVGYVVGTRCQSPVKNIRPIHSSLDTFPALDNHALQLTREMARRYGCSWGEAIGTSLPRALRGRKTLEYNPAVSRKTECFPSGMMLCHDKGLGRRWPFLGERVKETLTRGGDVICLVPERSQMDPVKAFLKEHLDEGLSVLDRRLTPKKELEEWVKIKEGRTRIVLGTRSAVFAPVKALGLIVIFEEENAAYKQEQSPYYHAREVALMRSRIEGGSVLFVTSTPSAEIWREIKLSKIPIKTLEAEHMAPLNLIDLSNYKPQRKAALTFPLQNRIRETLAEGKKVLLFLNRRGFSRITQCNQCGHVITCPRCDAVLAYLYSRKKLVCPLCHTASDLPQTCPQCQGGYLRSLGAGIEKLESEVARLCPEARTCRFDRETITIPAKTDVAIGTQAVLKRLKDFSPALTGVLDFDAELNRFDFRCAQRAFSLLIRLRQSTTDEVLVQTFARDSYCVTTAMALDFDKFYKTELKLRKDLGFPPFKHLVAVVLRGAKEESVFCQARDLFQKMKEKDLKGIEIMDPQPDLQPKLRDKYRFTIMLKSGSLTRMLPRINKILKTFKKKSGVILSVQVDP